MGDVVEYQIISTLPTITSKATSLTTYTFADTLSEGIRYNRSDVIIEFFRDAGCTDQITAWDEDSGKFVVSYDDAQNTMTIGMTETGLAEINESESVYTGSVKRGYSDCTMPCAADCEKDMEDVPQVPDSIRPLLMLSGCCPSALAQLLEEGDIVYAAE